MLPEVLTHPLLDHLDGDARSIRRDQATLAPYPIYLPEHLLLDVQPFHHYLDDPVVVPQLLHIVGEVAHRNPFGEVFSVQRRGLTLDGGLERLSRYRITYRGLSFRIAHIARQDIQHQHFQSDVSKVAGNSGAHYPRAQNGYAADVAGGCSHMQIV